MKIHAYISKLVPRPACDGRLRRVRGASMTRRSCVVGLDGRAGRQAAGRVDGGHEVLPNSSAKVCAVIR